MTGPGDDLAERGAALLRDRGAPVPSVGLILGSGLGPVADAMEVAVEVPFEELPGFPPPTVPGHAGRLRVGTLAGVPVAAFLGRVHFYEGHAMPLVTLPARLAAALGARTLIVTAAVGALDPALAPGSLVVLTDHLSFLGENPLRGWRDDDGGPPFVELASAYDPALVELALAAAGEAGLPAVRGVYAAMPGPTYETPAEAAFLRASGATVAGMSVVPDVLAARALGVRCLGLSCVTNAVGPGVSHEEVTRVAATFAEKLGRVLERILPSL